VVWKPSKDDVSGWCTLCFGHLSVSRPRDELLASNDTDDVTCSDSDASSARHISCLGGTPPLLSIVTHMDQVICLSTLLAIITHVLSCLDFCGYLTKKILAIILNQFAKL